MARKAADLLQRNLYARRVAASRGAQMLFDGVHGIDAVRTMRVEASDRRIFDDLVETRLDGSIHAWQIKRQAAALPEEAVREILQALRDQGDVSVGHVAIEGYFSVARIGEIRHLRSLCTALSVPGSNADSVIVAASSGELAWLTLLDEVGGGRHRAIQIARRLRVDVVGDDEQVRRRILEPLSALYVAPLDTVVEHVERFFTEVDATTDVTAELLELELAGFDRRPVRLTTAARATRRKTVLDATLRADAVVDPILRVLGNDIAPGLLAAVRMPVMLQTHSGDRLPLEAWATRVATENFLISGVVGSGKSSLLSSFARLLGEEAQLDQTKPIPLLLRVRDVIDADPLEVGAKLLRIDVDALRRLREDPLTTWILLLDGADEHAAGWHVIETVVAAFGDRCRRVFVSTRPVGLPQLRGYRVLELQQWSEDGVDLFLDRWATFDEATVASLRASSAFRELRSSLLRNPLLATLCLVVASRRKRVPTDRTRLFAEAIEILFESWREQRGPRDLQWQSVSDVLSRVAYEYLSRGAPIEPTLLHDLVHTLGVTPTSAATRELERNLGVLVPNGAGTYDFLFRGIAEHLAARHVLAGGESRVADVAAFGWGEEVVRHAVGLAAIRSPESASAILRKLARSTDGINPTLDAAYLRPLIVALRICRDLPALAEGCASQVAETAFPLLADETSCWIGERVAQELAQAPSNDPVLAALLEPSLAFLDTDEDLYGWYATQIERSPEIRPTAVFHRDPAVRLLGVHHLDFTEAPGFLVPELFDGGMSFAIHRGSPALEAGLKIREGQRGVDFTPTLQLLTRLLDSNEQVIGCAAALALRPTEADPKAIARALMLGAQAFDLPVHVIDELVAVDEAAVTEAWPDWKAKRDQMAQERILTPARINNPRSFAPPSPEVRASFLRAFHPMIGVVREKALITLTRQRGHLSDLVLVDMIVDGNRDALPRLRLRGISITAQRRLSVAAVRYDWVRRALLDSWTDKDEAKPGADFPGVALEELVVAGDNEATAIYAKWIGCSLYNYPFVVPSPPAAVFRDARVFEAASKIVSTIVERTSVPYAHESERPALMSRRAAAVSLRFYWPVWVDNADVLAALEQWALSEDIEDLLATVSAVRDVPVPNHVRATVMRRCGEVLREYVQQRQRASDDGTFYRFQVQACLGWIADQPCNDELRQAVETLVGLRDEVGVTAAGAMLCWLTPAAAAELSARVAWVGVRIASSRLDEETITALIAAAPEAWATALEELFSTSMFPEPSLFIGILPHLPSELQQRVAQAIHRRAGTWELPWTSNSHEAVGRPADVARRALYDAGLPLETSTA